jgi:L-iditol 2-dehydrogenase
MKAVVKLQKGYGHIEVKEVPEPPLRPDGVKVEIQYCGVCGTDVKIYHDEHGYYRPPLILGHEFSGTVVEVGAEVRNVRVGARVVVPPGIAQPRSLYGQSQNPWGGLGRRGFQADWGFTSYGGFTKYGVYNWRSAIELPKGVDLESAALAEPLAVCVHGIVGKARIHCSDVVVVSGPGPIGLLTAQLAKAEGAKVILLGVGADKTRLAVAKELGIDLVLNVEEQDPVPVVLEHSFGSGADVVCECVGMAASVTQCLKLARRGAQFIQLGTSRKEMTVDFAQISYKELNVIGSFNYERVDWEIALNLIDQGKVQVKPLITHKLPLSGWQEGFALSDDKRGIKVLLYPED